MACLCMHLYHFPFVFSEAARAVVGISLYARKSSKRMMMPMRPSNGLWHISRLELVVLICNRLLMSASHPHRFAHNGCTGETVHIAVQLYRGNAVIWCSHAFEI